MPSLQIDNDGIEDRGDAQSFLREVAREIGEGYNKGPGWEYSEGDSDEVPEEAHTPDPIVIVDAEGTELALEDTVHAVGVPEGGGEPLDVTAKVVGLSAAGTVYVQLDPENVEAVAVFLPEQVTKVEPEAAPSEAPAPRRFPWEKPHDQSSTPNA